MMMIFYHTNCIKSSIEKKELYNNKKSVLVKEKYQN